MPDHELNAISVRSGALRVTLHVALVLSLVTAALVVFTTNDDGSVRVRAAGLDRLAPLDVRAPAPTTAPALATTTAPVPLATPTTVAAPSATPPGESATPVSTTTPPAPVPAPVDPRSLPSIGARLTAPVVSVYAAPGAAVATSALYAVTEFGNPRVLPVTALGGDWLQVLVPTRPNSSTGWIRRTDATLTPIVDAVVVDQQRRTLTWMHAGAPMLTTDTAVGAANSPTPTGLFFVTDVLASNPSSAYGAWVVALDAHSDAFTEFEGGDARIAIHGTDTPTSIGAAASAGCLRVAPDPLATLAHGLPLGTPVLVR